MSKAGRRRHARAGVVGGGWGMCVVDSLDLGEGTFLHEIISMASRDTAGAAGRGGRDVRDPKVE